MKIINNNQPILDKGLGLFNQPTKVERNVFGEIFTQSIKRVDALEKESQRYNAKLATGQLENIHEAMIAAQKSEISMQLMLQIRNKVLDAYREITRMQI